MRTAAPTSLDVRTLADRADIVDVTVRYARALDRRDWALLRTCFTEDATIEYEGMPPINGTDDLVDVCRRALDPLDATQHLLGNHVVDVDGDEASGDCYLHAQHLRRGTPGGDTYVVAGSYHDRLRRERDGWRIAHRRLTVSWTAGNSEVLNE